MVFQAMRSGELLKAWRKSRGFTQEKAAEELDISQAAVSEYERGEKSPDVKAALRIAQKTKNAVPVKSWAEPSAEATGEHPVVTSDATGTGEG